MFLDYSQYMSELRDAFDKRVNDFLEIYPDIVKAAPSRLGDAYRKDDFPSPKQMRDYFGFNLKFSPVPKITDWRLDDLSQADIETIRQETEAEVQEMFSGAIAEVYERSADVLSRILKQLKSDDGIIRKPTLDNVKEMAELVLKMNITNDEGLNRLGLQMMEIFADHEAAEMRGDADLRKKIAAAAEKLMKGIPNG